METYPVFDLLNSSLRKVIPALFEAESLERSVIFEGCFLAHDWFRLTVGAILESTGHSFSAIRNFRLKRPPEVVYRQICERAKTTQNYEQLKVFTDVRATEHNERWFEDFLSPNVWETILHPDLLELEIRHALAIE